MLKKLFNATRSSKMNSTHLLFITFGIFGICCNHNSVAAESCLTPNNALGECMSIYQCTHIITILNATGRQHLPQLSKYLTAARCESQDGEQVRVCCAKAGFDILNALDCGKTRGDRIANGIDAYLRQFPWMALLKYNTAITPYKCGGTLITNRFVLSAAHCVVGQEQSVIGVRLGEHNTATESDCEKYGRRIIKCNPPVEDFGVVYIKTHPQYDRRELINDIALIKLDRDVTFKQHIKPICLPITEVSAVLPTDAILTVAGWGLTEEGSQSSILQYAMLREQQRSVCSSIFRKNITENHICALGENLQDTCRGDSGGPLFAQVSYKDQRRYVQYGVVSFGVIGCGDSTLTYPAVYANVLDLMPWIVETIA